MAYFLSDLKLVRLNIITNYQVYQTIGSSETLAEITSTPAIDWKIILYKCQLRMIRKTQIIGAFFNLLISRANPDQTHLLKLCRIGNKQIANGTNNFVFFSIFLEWKFLRSMHGKFSCSLFCSIVGVSETNFMRIAGLENSAIFRERKYHD